MEAEEFKVQALADSAVIIWGGTSGVGLASAFALGEAGVVRLLLCGRSLRRGNDALGRLRAKFPQLDVHFFQADATDYEAVENAVAAARQMWSRVDIVINSVASPYAPELLLQTPSSDIADMFLLQAMPAMLSTRVVLPLMIEQRGGVIINIASDAAKVATPGESVLGAAMAGIVMFSRTVAMEAKRSGVRVNVVTPSLITGTPTFENATRRGLGRSLLEKATSAANLGLATPEDVASLVVYLASPVSARITGQAVSVNGGLSAI